MSDNRILNFDDKVKYKDAYKMERGQASKSPKLYTEVEYYNELGEHLFTEHNELLLSGGLFVLQKLINADAPISIQTVNTDLNIEPTETTLNYTGVRREMEIIGFMVGVGGCTDVFDTVAPVYYKERKIEGLIPIRKVNKANDLSPEQKQKYFLRKENNGYVEYYGKKFETKPVIKVEFDKPGFPSVPANVDTLPTNDVINNYMQFTLKINKEDVREYFKLNGGGLNKTRVNTLGLVFGYPETNNGVTEYKGVRVFSKLNFNNEPLDNETKELTVVYKIYI